MIQSHQATKPDLRATANESTETELLLLPDGRILVHNLTPAMAALLNELNLADNEIALRSALWTAEAALDASMPPQPRRDSAGRSRAARATITHHELPD